MAVDLTPYQPPGVSRVTLSATPDETTQIIISARSGRVSLRFIGQSGKFSFDGADAAPIGAHFATVNADSWIEIAWRGDHPPAKSSLFLASPVASTVVEILSESPKV
jgi:hypothetical protein